MASFAVSQVIEGEWTSYKCIDVLGVTIPAFVTNDPQVLRDFISTFQTRPDDVFVVGYPKSGTTWTEEIVWQIYNEGAVDSKRVGDRVVFLDSSTNPLFNHPDIKTLPSPRLLKTHLPYSTIPKSADDDTRCKYIYVARNPKDVAVSYFTFMVNHPKEFNIGYNGPWEFYAKLFIEGNVGWNFWNDHVLGWWKHRDDPNVLFIKYEDMKKPAVSKRLVEAGGEVERNVVGWNFWNDHVLGWWKHRDDLNILFIKYEDLHKDLPSHVRMIAEFLNKPLTDELANRIAEQCTFNGMMKNAESYRTGGSNSLLRKGVVGDWKNYFTPELNERFEKEVLAKLKGTGLEFDFEIN